MKFIRVVRVIRGQLMPAVVDAMDFVFAWDADGAFMAVLALRILVHFGEFADIIGRDFNSGSILK